MFRMGKDRPEARRLWLITGIVCVLFLIFILACNRQKQLQPTAASSAQSLPFHQDGHAFETDPGRPDIPAETKNANTAPFQTPQRVLPSGSLLTVQLKTSLNAAKVHPGDVFKALLAAPFTVNGSTIIERATPLVGHVESAQSQAEEEKVRGYIRLKLDSITIDGRTLSLQTSSLFVRANAELSGDGSQPSLRVQKGRHLTFRLTAPMVIGDTTPVVERVASRLPAE
jgi:hypothetical protein